MSKTQVFIEKARAVHGDRYDYGKVVYVRVRDKVVITCKRHGDFEQRACNHLTGGGCSKCSGKHQHSTAEWIIEAKKTHGDRYDYSKVVYVRAHDRVIITCKEHGDFEQQPFSHLAGRGCAKCSGTHQYSTAEWIIEAKKTHGDRYDYSKTVYVRRYDRVTVTCKEHGDFEQVAAEHARGNGCSKCSGKHQHSTAEWIIEAKKTHGDRYDYSKVVYVRSQDKVIITCKDHGGFKQTANDHTNGRGCPRCFWDRDQPTAIYLMQMGGQVKIGISIDPESRLAQLNRNNPEPAHIVTTWTLEDFPTAYTVEQKLHQRLRDYHAGLSGFDGATEWFNTTPCHAEWVIAGVIGQHL